MARWNAVLAISCFLAAPVRAAGVVSFENALAEIRRGALAGKAALLQRRKDGLAEDIQKLSDQTRRLDWDSSRLRRDLDNLRRRAQRYAAPRRPGQPDPDPFLRMDLDRFIWDLRDFCSYTANADRAARSYLASATKDPALVAPAQNLHANANPLWHSVNWLASDARFAESDFRRAGFHGQASDLYWKTSDADRDAHSLLNTASQLLDKVR